MAVAWIVLRKMVRIKNRFHCASIADYMAARYGKSQALAALATAVALIGSMPYIALQFKAILETFEIITQDGSMSGFVADEAGFLLLGIMIVFTISIGVRRLDTTERHQGMMLAISVESLVKLVVFLCVGVFVTFLMNDGFSDLLARAGELGQTVTSVPAVQGGRAYMQWMTYLVLAMAAMLTLRVTAMSNWIAFSTMSIFGEIGTVEDIGWAAVYLCSQAGRFVTGTNLMVDGGISIGF